MTPLGRLGKAPAPPGLPMTYSEYLRTDHWLNLRTRALTRANHICSNCGADGPLQVHHKTYRQGWFSTRIEDLVALCEDCHSKVHASKVVAVQRRPRGLSRNKFEKLRRDVFGPKKLSKPQSPKERLKNQLAREAQSRADLEKNALRRR